MKISYYLVAIPVGVGCFYAFVVFLFSLGDSLFGSNDPMRAFLSATGGISGITAYLFIGRPLFGSYKHIPATLGTIFVSALLTFMVIAGMMS